MSNFQTYSKYKPLVVAVTIGTLIAPQIIKLHCKDRREGLVCLDDDVDEPPHQTQKISDDAYDWGNISYSRVPASGNASVYPSPSPSPAPV